jgi:hypothetical protein
VAAPAKAQTVPCRLSLSSQTIVVLGPGQIDIYPSNAAPYATAVADGVRSYVSCLVSQSAGPLLSCAKTLVNNRPTVTVDPVTLQITIDYSDFLATACTV